MKNSFSVTLFLVGCMLMHSDCGAMGPVKSAGELTKEVKSLKKEVSALPAKFQLQSETFGRETANLRVELQQQGTNLVNDIASLRNEFHQERTNLGNDITGLRDEIQQYKTYEGGVKALFEQLQKRVDELSKVNVSEVQKVSDVSLFDIYARIDVAVNCFNVGGRDVIRKSLEEVKGMKFDSIDMLHHKLYATGILSAFEKFCANTSWFLSGSHENLITAFLNKMTNISAYSGDNEYDVSVSFKDLFSRVCKLSNSEVSIDDLYGNGCSLILDNKDGNNIDESSEENTYRVQSLDVVDLCEIIDQFKISDADFELLTKEWNTEVSAISNLDNEEQ